MVYFFSLGMPGSKKWLQEKLLRANRGEGFVCKNLLINRQKGTGCSVAQNQETQTLKIVIKYMEKKPRRQYKQ
jgi:hypothetical protein